MLPHVNCVYSGVGPGGGGKEDDLSKIWFDAWKIGTLCKKNLHPLRLLQCALRSFPLIYRNTVPGYRHI